MDETLYKVNYLDAPNGKVQIYRIYTTQVGNEWDLDAQAGQEGGNLRTTNHNPKGGRYATLGDAEAKANSKIKEKTDRGYQSTKLGAQNDPIFLPMLALGTKNKDGSLKMEDFNNLDFPVIVQRKFDGVRGIATVNANGSIKFVSRKNNEYTIPIKHIRQEIASMANLPDDIILDGELYAEPADLDFNVANGLVRTSAKSMNPEKEAQEKLLKYRVYDFFDPNNRDLTYTERHAMLDKWITPQMTSLVLTKNYIVNGSQEIVDLSERFVRERYEGGIVRIPSAPYGVDMRNKNLMLKVKFFIDAEFEIVDFTDGDTSSSEGLVKWIVMTPEGDTFKVSMNAPHDEQRKLFQEGEKYIGADLTVEFERYSQYGIPMKPRGKSIRNYE